MGSLEVRYCFKPRRGFSLVELMFVVMIILTLAAIVLPAMLRTKEAAKETVCISNVKQIALGNMVYASDYDDYICPSGFININAHKYWGWWTYIPDYTASIWAPDPSGGLLYPYLKSPPIQDCPSAVDLPDALKVLLPYPGGLLITNPQKSIGSIAYGINGNLNFAPANSFSEVSLPAETVYMADSASVDTATVTVGRSALLAVPATGGQSPGIHGRHGGLANISWLDGHAKTSRIVLPTTPNALFPLLTPAVFQAAQLGTILKPGCSWGDASCMSYYYILSSSAGVSKG